MGGVTRLRGWACVLTVCGRTGVAGINPVSASVVTPPGIAPIADPLSGTADPPMLRELTGILMTPVTLPTPAPDETPFASSPGTVT